MRINELYTYLDRLYPFNTAEGFDNSGFVYKSENQIIKKALLCLDITLDAVKEAVSVGADVIISHHPLAFEGIKKFDFDKDNVLVLLIKHGISAISLHTNFDAAENGLNVNLARILGLKNVSGIVGSNGGKYAGIVGEFDTDSFDEIALNIKEALEVPTLKVFDSGEKVKKAVIVSGAGFSFFEQAVSTGADLFITGQCKYHNFNEAYMQGISLIDAGHFYTERIFGDILENALLNTDIETVKYKDKIYYKEI